MTSPAPGEFMLGDQKDPWLAARLEDLDYGDIDGICAAARTYPLAAARPAASEKLSAATSTTRQAPPDQPRPEDDPGYLQN